MREIGRQGVSRAAAARGKKAAFGEDLDLEKYTVEAPEHAYREKLSELAEVDRQRMAKAGVDARGKERSGSFVQLDNSVVHRAVQEKGIEILGTREALDKYDWLQEYMWKTVDVDADKFTAAVELDHFNGYFIRALPGAHTVFPVQACLYIKQGGLAQRVHNIIIAEEGSELHIITGCTSDAKLPAGLHLGVSEFYVKKGAQVTFTMVHNWAENLDVRPRTGTIVEEDGVFLSNYICMEPVRSLQMYPKASLVGKGAVARYNSILVAQEGSSMDVGAKVSLEAPGTRAEVVARAITRGGDIISRGMLVGEVEGVKAHLECRGLILAERGLIHAIPELIGKVDGVDLSHEAAVGKIAKEEVEYLMARGLSEEEATATIVRGFLNVNIEGLPPILAAEMQKMLKALEEKAL
jgi:hypothetical protein